jgi:hypothetical protein
MSGVFFLRPKALMSHDEHWVIIGVYSFFLGVKLSPLPEGPIPGNRASDSHRTHTNGNYPANPKTIPRLWLL